MLDVCLVGTGGMMPLPRRWLTALMTRYNATKLGDLDYDQNGISIEPSYIGQDYDSLLGQVNDTFTLSDFQAMADGSYFDAAR